MGWEKAKARVRFGFDTEYNEKVVIAQLRRGFFYFHKK